MILCHSILARLRETGWGKEVDYLGKEGLDTMRRMPVLRQSSKLTDGGEYALYSMPTFMLMVP